MRYALLILCALGCGIVGGAFFAFSTFIMRALEKLPPAQGIAAMQAMNVTVAPSGFIAVFVATAAGCAILSIWSAVASGIGASRLLIAGCALYVIGTFVLTLVCNVPLNNALAAATPSSPDAEALWRDYLVRWTVWNHVRTIAAVLAAGLLISQTCRAGC